MGIKSYRDLIAWQKSMDLVVLIYAISQQFPDQERYGLINQIRRAVVSIPANIAEGHGRIHTGDYARFLSIARGSLMEVETLLLIAQRLDFVAATEHANAWSLIEETGRLLNGLIRSIRTTIHEDTTEYLINLDQDQPDP